MLIVAMVVSVGVVVGTAGAGRVWGRSRQPADPRDRKAMARQAEKTLRGPRRDGQSLQKYALPLEGKGKLDDNAAAARRWGRGLRR